jgi:hypothetical protein
MRDKVQLYYGEVLQSSADLKTNACCTIEDIPSYVSDVIAQIHAEVPSSRRYMLRCAIVTTVVA